MTRTFYILDSFLMPTGYNHMFMVQKIARGFGYKGFSIKIAGRVSDINKPGFVMISDHPVYFSLGMRHNSAGNRLYMIPAAIEKIDKRKGLAEKISDRLQKEALRKLASQIEGKDITILAWALYEKKHLFEELDMRVIHLMNSYYTRPEREFERGWYDFCKNNRNSMPLRFAADIDPGRIGEGCKNARYVVSYVGDKGYVPEYRKLFEERADCKIVPTPPYITEGEKQYIYRNSMMNLGLHSSMNKREQMVGERIFEAIGFGAVSLTDNECAAKATDGSAIFVRNRDELRETVYRLEHDNEERKIRR